MGHVVILEEESLLARVVGALAKGGRLPARVVPRQVAVFIEIESFQSFHSDFMSRFSSNTTKSIKVDNFTTELTHFDLDFLPG